MTHYKYTVVIPTRNRQKYCIEAIKSVTQAGRNDVQIIVVDNSDDNSLDQLLDENNLLEKIHYLPSQEEVFPMGANWERAIDLVEGQWLSYIGDDDGYAPYAFDAFDFLTEKYTFKAFRWDTYNYKWPCFPTNNAGLLNFKVADFGVDVIYAPKELQKVQEWHTGNLWPKLGPSVYHGLVAYDLVKALKEQYGNYFVDNCTDYASSILNATRIEHYLSYQLPMTIMGASKRSNTAKLTGITPEDHKVEFNNSFKSCAKALEKTDLNVPRVANSIANVFAALNIDFSVSVTKLLTSCVNELKKINDRDTFVKAKALLIKFAQANHINPAPIEAIPIYIPGIPPKGYLSQEGKFFIDTLKMNLSGVFEVSQLLKAITPDEMTIHTGIYNNIKKQAPQFIK